MHDLRLVERPHVHVALGRPCRSRDVAQPCCGQVETGLAVRKGAHDACSAADLSHDALQRIVGPNLLPVNVREGVVGQRLVDTLLDEVSCLAHLAGPKILDDSSGLLVGGRSALLRMNGFEHVAHVTDLCRRHMAEDIAVEMNHAALPAGLG